MERENISVGVIAVHGHGHVVVISGMVFELEPGMFDPAIRKIEWAAGQGAFVGKMAGKIRYSGTMATKCISPPSVKAVGEEQRRVEDNVAILDAEHRRKTCATVRRRANLLGRIREVEEKWPIPRKPSLRRSPSEKPPMAKTCTISFGCVLGRVVS